MREIWDSLRRKRNGFDAPLTPDKPFAVVGDIHGCDDLLKGLLARLPHRPLIFVGDYIDRGPDSAGVLRRLKALALDQPAEVECLMGNHEAMLLDFLDHPEVSSKRWLRNGGCQTLESFGVRPPDDADVLSASDQLKTAMGTELIDWIRNRPLVWQSGNVVVTHAGADPKRPIDPRRGHGLLWGHPDFLKIPRNDNLWIVHGHYIVPECEANAGRISIDTGAYSSGTLAAAIVETGNVEFLRQRSNSE